MTPTDRRTTAERAASIREPGRVTAECASNSPGLGSRVEPALFSASLATLRTATLPTAFARSAFSASPAVNFLPALRTRRAATMRHCRGLLASGRCCVAPSMALAVALPNALAVALPKALAMALPKALSVAVRMEPRHDP